MLKAKLSDDRHLNHNTDAALKKLARDKQVPYHIMIDESLSTKFKLKTIENNEASRADVIRRLIVAYVEGRLV
jgi:hypothetical protein